jgi:ATP-dependent DNA ligase
MPMAIISFGFPRLNGQDRSEKSLVWAENIASTYGFVFAEWYELEKLQKQLNFKLSDGIEIVRKRLLELAKKLNYEGFVLKDTQYGKWYKVKHSPSVDCIVTDVSEGKDDKKYSGQVGALVVSLLKSKKLVEIANVSGMTESERLEMTELWKSKKLMGKVVEVTYQEVGARGRLRHPRFSRFRPDKPVRDCTWDQLEENC